jgi:mannose-6-phosphate isomerase-like protein (cupin superfamily)
MDAAGAEPSGSAVLSGADLFGRRRQVFGRLPIDLKVVGGQTSGGLLVLEQIDDLKGGPPRHVHLKQDEWFYVIEGNYVVEVGETRFDLGPGDSVLAPRGVPHVWAHVGDGTGRMLVEFHPAGLMEAFFVQATQLSSASPGPEMAKLFSDHGMELVGPPLQVE